MEAATVQMQDSVSLLEEEVGIGLSLQDCPQGLFQIVTQSGEMVTGIGTPEQLKVEMGIWKRGWDLRSGKGARENTLLLGDGSPDAGDGTRIEIGR